MKLTEVPKSTPAVLDALPIDIIYNLQVAAADQLEKAKRVQAIVSDTLERRFAVGINKLGTTRVDAGDYEAVVEMPKRVKWDQEKLVQARAVIRDQWHESPSEYIDETLSVKESKFNAWPDSIKSHFEAARTVECGKIKVELKKKDDAK